MSYIESRFDRLAEEKSSWDRKVNCVYLYGKEVSENRLFWSNCKTIPQSLLHLFEKLSCPYFKFPSLKLLTPAYHSCMKPVDVNTWVNFLLNRTFPHLGLQKLPKMFGKFSNEEHKNANEEEKKVLPENCERQQSKHFMLIFEKKKLPGKLSTIWQMSQWDW